MGEVVCTSCGFVGDPEPGGSGNIEFLLWVFLIVPGIVYSVWRHDPRNARCWKCHRAGVLPFDSPEAQKYLRQVPPWK